MKKKFVFTCIFGGLCGLAISHIIAIFISAILNDGKFYAVVPELITDCGSEINAVLLQTVFSFIYGAAWAGASYIWKIEKWSMLRHTVTHLIICSAATFPTAYFMKWMEHSVYGILSYFGIFLSIYLIIWFCMYFAMRKKIKEMNEKIKSDI